MGITAVDFVADVLRRRQIFGASVGDSLESVTQHFGFDFVDQTDGRGAASTLRRDFGVVESVFVDPAAWRCHAIFMPLHRVEYWPERIKQQCRRHNIEISGNVQWGQVQSILGADAKRWHVYQDQGNFVSYSSDGGATVIHVVNDAVGEMQQGDIWNVEINWPFH